MDDGKTLYEIFCEEEPMTTTTTTTTEVTKDKTKTRKIRLTPKQRDMLRGVAGGWGKVFTCFISYGFLNDKGLIRRATKAEIEEHYRLTAMNLEKYKSEAILALHDSQYQEAKRLAELAYWEDRTLQDREEDEPSLVVLTDEALALASEVKP